MTDSGSIYRYLSDEVVKQLSEQGKLNNPMMVPTRKSFAIEIVQIGKKNDKVVVLTADSEQTIQTYLFEDEFPDRHFHFGIAEQNMMAAAAGMATCGLMPFIAGFSIFMTMRALEQLRTSIHYPHLNVKIAASHSGITTGSDGVTHQAQEDIAIVRSIAGSTILAPADDFSARKAVKAASELDGPVFLSLTREPVPCLFDETFPYQIGKAYRLREGLDITLTATRDMVYQSLLAAEILHRKGIEARVVDFETVKPLDESELLAAAKDTGLVITAESGTINGGFGGAVAEFLSENCPVRIKRIGVRDVFTESASYHELLDKYRLSANHIAEASIELIKNN